MRLVSKSSQPVASAFSRSRAIACALNAMIGMSRVAGSAFRRRVASQPSIFCTGALGATSHRTSVAANRPGCRSSPGGRATGLGGLLPTGRPGLASLKADRFTTALRVQGLGGGVAIDGLLADKFESTEVWLRFHTPLIEPDWQISRVAQPLLAFAPTEPAVRRYRSGLFRKEGPEAGRSSVPSLMDNRFGEREGGQEPVVRRPGNVAFLASRAECLTPELDDAGLERAKSPRVEDDAIVPIVTTQHLAQPAMLLANRSVHPPPHLLSDLLSFRTMRFTCVLRLTMNLPLLVFPQ
jgi:hypothetical protein